jgi:tetratricopeptide (TPR) repeat protein
MRSAERLASLLALGALLGGCASAPPIVAKPVEAVKETATAVAATVAAAVPAVVAPAEAPVPAEAQRAFDAARAHLRAGRTADAERGFRELAARHPELGGAHANLGLILRGAGKLDESIAALEQAVKASPKQPVFHNHLALSYRQKGEFQKARNAYEQAIALDDNYADAHLNLGVLLDLYQNDPSLALAHYERYLALHPQGDAAVGKWVAELKTRKPVAVAQAGKKE